MHAEWMGPAILPLPPAFRGPFNSSCRQSIKNLMDAVPSLQKQQLLLLLQEELVKQRRQQQRLP